MTGRIYLNNRRSFVKAWLHLSIGKGIRRFSILLFIALGMPPILAGLGVESYEKSYTGLALILPIPFGTASTTIDGYLDSVLRSSYSAPAGSYSASYTAFQAKWRQAISSQVSIVTSFSYLVRFDKSIFFADSSLWYRNFELFTISIGPSYAHAIGKPDRPVMLYTGIGAGVMEIKMSDELWGADFFTFASTESALCITWDLLLSIPFATRWRIEAGIAGVFSLLTPYRVFFPDRESVASAGFTVGVGRSCNTSN